MINRYFQILVYTSILFFTSIGKAQESKKSIDTSSKPNILFIAIDDLKWFDQWVNGNKIVQTPHLDSLAKMSTVFSNAHCQSPACSPSRNSLLTGLRPSTTGIYGFQIKEHLTTIHGVDKLPTWFRKNGYNTIGTGKIEHSRPFEGVDTASWDYYYPSLQKPQNHNEGKVNDSSLIIVNSKLRWGHVISPEDSMGDADEANWISDQILNYNDSLPFFMAYGCYHPHLPWFAPKKYFDLYDTSKIIMPDVLNSDSSDLGEMGKYMMRRHQKDHILTQSHNLRKQLIQAYYASVSFADAQVGKVLKALRNSKHAHNTIIVLWSDHGWHLGDKNTYRKFTLWRNATQVPFFMYVPNGKTQISASPVELMDIYPTLLNLCKLPMPQHQLEGKDLSPILINGAHINKPAVVTWGRDNHAIVNKYHTYIRYYNGEEELYDHTKDPNLFHNAANAGFMKNIKLKMMANLPDSSAANLEPTRKWDKVRSTDYPDLP